MEAEVLKNVRFSMLMQVLTETSAISTNEQFKKWCNTIQRNHKNNSVSFDDLYAEVDEFVKSNYDLIHLFLTLKNQCQGSIKEPLRVKCDRL